jgi:hypothetical protein
MREAIVAATAQLLGLRRSRGAFLVRRSSAAI